MKSLKKLFAVTLAVLFTLSCMVMAGTATETPYTGIGTEDDPYVITDAEGFLALSGDTAFCAEEIYIELGADIDFTGLAFVPFATEEAPFKGSFDGKGYTIGGISFTASENAALFLYTDGAEIKNIAVDGSKFKSTAASAAAIVAEGADTVIDSCVVNCDIYGTDNVAGIIAEAKNCSIANCKTGVDSYINGVNCVGGIAGSAEASENGETAITACGIDSAAIEGSSYVGGIIGYAGANTVISGCDSSADITNNRDYYGGIAGYAEKSEIDGCVFTGVLYGQGTVGGIVGQGEEITVSSCGSSCIIDAGYTHAGGIAGLANGSEISDCYSDADVTGTEFVGGIAGQSNNTSISTTYFAGLVSGDEDSTGGIAGKSTESEFSGVFFISDLDSDKAVGTGDDTGALVISTEDAADEATYEGFDFENGWTFIPGHSDYPLFAGRNYHVNYEEYSVTPPTCTEKGFTTYWCTDCESYFNDTFVDETGHDVQIVEQIAPTCTEDGYIYSKCANCDYEQTETIEALGHTDEDGDNICDTCGNEMPVVPYGLMLINSIIRWTNMFIAWLTNLMALL